MLLPRGLRARKLHRNAARIRWLWFKRSSWVVCGAVALVLAWRWIQPALLISAYVQDTPEEPKTETVQVTPGATATSAATLLSVATQSASIRDATSSAGVQPDGKQKAGIQIPILMYHYVEHVQDPHDTLRHNLNTSPELLESQLLALQAEHYTFLLASDVAAILDGQKALPSKPIVLTFDDGYRDFYTDALPILKKHHIPATLYVISGLLDQPNYLFKTQLAEIAQSGLVEIGAHTVTHPDLSQVPLSEAATEITQSKTQLEKLLNVPVRTFAYPGGRFNDQTVKAVAAAGYDLAVSTKPGIVVNQNNRFTLYRLRPGGRTGAGLVEFLREEAAL